MNAQALIRQLEAEGFTDVHICPIAPNQVDPPHPHPLYLYYGA